MEKKAIIVLFLLFTIAANAQSKLQLGVMAAYDMTSGTDAAGQAPTSFKNNSGFEIGISGYKKIIKILYWNVGLHYAKRNFWEGGIFQSGYTHPGKIVYKWDDWNMPVYLNLRIPITQRIAISSTAGLTLAVGISNKETWYTPDGDVDTYSRRLRLKSRVFPSFGLGAMYKINDKYSLMVLPHIMNEFLFWGSISYDFRCTLLRNL